MPEQESTLRKVDWNRIFPWLMLFRVFSISITAQVLLLATVGSMAVPLGWRFSELLFVSQEEDIDADDGDPQFVRLVENLRQFPGQSLYFESDAGDGTRQLARIAKGDIINGSVGWVGDVTSAIVQPIGAALGPQQFLRRRVYLLFGSLWMLAVWGIIAGMICRLAVVRLAQDERLTLKETFAFSCRRWHSHACAPLFPLGGLVLVAALITMFSLLLQTGTWYGVVLGIFWLPVLVGGCLMAVVRIGLMFGWPLMWPAVASEETGDVFEATSRSFSYTFQRPLHYLFYAIVASLIGGLAVALVQLFGTFVIELSSWAAAAGGGENWGAMFDEETAGGWLVGLGNVVVYAITHAYAHGLFWCSVSAIYLLLRKNVDHTALDVIFLEDEESRYDLPELEVAPPSSTQDEPPPSLAEADAEPQDSNDSDQQDTDSAEDADS